MMKSNQKFKIIVPRRNNNQRLTNKFKDGKANYMFKEFTNNIKYKNESNDINNGGVFSKKQYQKLH